MRRPRRFGQPKPKVGEQWGDRPLGRLGLAGDESQKPFVDIDDGHRARRDTEHSKRERRAVMVTDEQQTRLVKIELAGEVPGPPQHRFRCRRNVVKSTDRRWNASENAAHPLHKDSGNRVVKVTG
jgi:hypothetical protein